jgi:hypothetical protein
LGTLEVYASTLKKRLDLTVTVCLDTFLRRRAGTEEVSMSRAPDAGGPEDREPAGRPRWVSVAVITLTLALLGLIVVLHLSGVIGPGVH